MIVNRKMKIAIMQPYFFPYLGYFQLINAVDKFVVYDDVNFIKRGWINRNNILLNDKPHLFSLPLIKASQNKLINEIDLFLTDEWITTFLKTIKQSYQKAENFKSVCSLLEKILFFNEKNLSSFLANQLIEISNYLNIDTKIIKTSTQYNNKHLNRAERLIDICKQEEANHYINALGGQLLYDKSFFQTKKIQLSFIQSDKIIYKQNNNFFVPNLSIIDVMMFNSVEEIKRMLDKYTLI